MGLKETAPSEAVLTKEFLEKILQKKIFEFEASTGSNPGDNFTSILVSVEVVLEDDKNKPLYLLLKTFPNHPLRQKFLEDINLFGKELNVYSVWIPELIKFQKQVLENDKILLPAVPEFVAGAAIDYTEDRSKWSNLDPITNNYIMMVDVRKTHGFQMANKLKSLGQEHAQIVLEEIAKYHALGHAYKQHYKLTRVHEKFPFLEDPFFRLLEQKGAVEGLLSANIQLIMDSCKEFLEGRPKILESLNKFKDPQLAWQYFYKFLDPKGFDEEEVEGWMRIQSEKWPDAPLTDPWIVTGHGDFWTNNMLFKSDETGKPTEAIIVDLQVARESCIMTDIVYFMYTSTDTDFRKQHLDEMLQWYHDRFIHFCSVLKTDPFPGFTLDNFRRRFHRSRLIGLLFSSVTLPIILRRQETAVNLDEVNMEVGAGNSGKDEWAEMMTKEGRDEDDLKLLRDRYIKMLTELYDQGVL